MVASTHTTTAAVRSLEGTVVANAYIVPRAALDAAETDRHCTQLTMVPIDSYRGDNNSFAMYTLTRTHLMVPRFYGLKNFGTASRDLTWCGTALEPSRCTFAGQLKPEQHEVVARARERFETDVSPRGGCLVLPCGFGKTVIAIHVVAVVLRVKTIIMVHTKGLLEQWCDRIRTFAPGLSVGVHQQGHLDTECDVLVAMIQTVARRTYSNELSNRGLVIVDEAHHLGARVYGSAMAKLACKFTLGLSATPDRRDGLTRIQFMTLGTIIFKVERGLQHVCVTELLFDTSPPPPSNGRPNYAALVNEVAQNRARSKVLVDHILRLQKVGRIIIVLSERKHQLAHIREMLKDGGMSADDIGYYVGESNSEERARCATCSVTLSTFQMAREGLDQPRLNCLVLASPCSDLVQAVGRIQRRQTDTPPLVIDAIDSAGIFRGMARKRHLYYKQSGFTTQRCSVASGNVESGELFH